MINFTVRSDILVFNCYLCHVRFLLTCYVCSTKIGEISDISKCFENFVSQTLGILTRIYAAELREYIREAKVHQNSCATKIDTVATVNGFMRFGNANPYLKRLK